MKTDSKADTKTRKRPGRPAKKSTGATSQPVVRLEQQAFQALNNSAEALGLTNSTYASAAISYFAERGLNPVSDREREGMVIQAKIDAHQATTEKMITSLGNRLFGWLTQHEKNLNSDLFGFLRGHEKALFSYLEVQDKYVHEHLADQEEMFLLPLMRELLITNVEALFSRRLGEQIILKVLGRELSEYPAKHKEFNQKRDVDAKKRLDDFVESLSPAPQPAAAKPQPTPIPERPTPPAPAPKAAAEPEPEMKF